MIFGMLPIALALSEGSEFRAPSDEVGVESPVWGVESPPRTADACH
jgi:hypothetical protein